MKSVAAEFNRERTFMNRFPFDRTYDVPSQLLGEGGQLSRRTALKHIGTGSLIAVAAPTLLLQEACKPKDLNVYVQTVVGALQEIQPLLPALSGKIGAAIKVALDFNAQYQRGDYVTATQTFETLASNVSEIITDIGVSLSPAIKVALTVAGIGLRAIAVLLKAQSEQPQVAKAIKGMKASSIPPPPNAGSRILKLADPVALDKAFEASKP
jgi:hypothetical protein